MERPFFEIFGGLEDSCNEKGNDINDCFATIDAIETQTEIEELYDGFHAVSTNMDKAVEKEGASASS